MTSQHGVKGRQFWQSQVASINDEDDSFKLLQDSVNELKSRGLVDGYLTVDDYVNIDFEVCTSETSVITDREILDSILINDYVKKKRKQMKSQTMCLPKSQNNQRLHIQ